MFLALGIFLLYFAFKGINIDQLINDLKTAEYSWVILSLLFAFLALFSRSYRWNLIIEPLGYRPPLSSTFYAVMTGYLANFALPRLGEITRCASLAKKEKIPVDKLLGTVIVERAVDLLSLFTLLLLLLILKFETFGGFLRYNVFNPVKEKVSASLGFSWTIWIIFFIMVAFSFILYYLVFREILDKSRRFTKFKSLVKGVFDGLKTVYKMKKRGEFLFHTVIIWVLYLLMTWVVVFALPATSHLKLIDGLFILVIGGLGMSAPVQSGIGAFHWIISRGLATVYPMISVEQGLVFATISHGSQALMMIFLGVLSLYMLFYKKKSGNESLNAAHEKDVKLKSA